MRVPRWFFGFVVAWFCAAGNLACRTPSQVKAELPTGIKAAAVQKDDDLPGALNSSQVHVKWLEKQKDGVLPVMEMGSDSARLDRKSQSGSFSGARVQLYQDGKKAARLTAAKVVAVEAKHQLQAEGGVILTSLDPKGVTVKADRAVWHYKAGRIVAVGHVTMIDQPEGESQPIATGGPWPTMRIDTAMKMIQVP